MSSTDRRYCPHCHRLVHEDVPRCPDDASHLWTEMDLAALRNVEDPNVGAVVGERYRLVRLLGRGAMGAVYLAIDHRLWKRVAVKLFLDDLSLDAERFAARIGDPHVADVL